jgi:hypothetical protein
MLRSLKDIQTYKVHAVDGDIGSVHSFLFDDHEWIVRYLVVDLGGWLSGRKVLVSPNIIQKADGEQKILFVALPKKKIKESPDIDKDKPVSRKKELETKKHDLPIYWGATGKAPYVFTHLPPPKMESGEGSGLNEEKEASYLRSSKEVMDYRIEARDGEIGHVEDFIVENEVPWNIRYIAIDTRNWLPGRKVLISPHWAKRISWALKELFVDLSMDDIKNSPEFVPDMPVNREYEDKLYDYYGRPKYWS